MVTHNSNSKRKLAQQRRSEAQAVLLAAEATPCDEVQDTLNDLGKKLLNDAKRLEKDEPAVLPLPSDATAKEIAEARCRQAVRVGDETYLPEWGKDKRGLPNHFLRSALFCAARTPPAAPLTQARVNTLNDLTLIQDGCPLTQFDRQVYANLLEHYRSTPLAQQASLSNVLSTSFHALATLIGASYSLNVHKSLVASILRLSSIQLHVRFKKQSMPGLRLLNRVQFTDAHGRPLDPQATKGSSKIHFCITEDMAELFGVGRWTAVANSVVRLRELKGWLANFYATHSGAQPLPLPTLQKLSGYLSHESNFRPGLITALDHLKSETIPDKERIQSYTVADNNSLTVMKAHWKADSVNVVTKQET